MNKKTLKVKFVDMSYAFNGQYGRDYKQHIIYKLLAKHYDLIDSDSPQIIFCEFNGTEFVKYDCVRVFFSAENYKPDFDLYDYCITMFEDFKYQDRCLTTQAFVMFESTKLAYDLALKKHEFSAEDLKAKTGFCSFVYSNSNAFFEREKFFHLLSEYKRVDSAGRFLNNMGYRAENKLEFESNYKFSIAFDNQLYSIIQEKITDGFGAKLIPIYYGNPIITSKFNPKAFINCHAFNNFSEVIDYVKKIDQDDNLYMSIMREPICDLNRTSDYYLNELEEFLVKIAEGGTIQRAKELWPIWLERERVYGRKKRLRDEKIAMMLGKVFKPLRKLKIAKWAQKKLLWLP